MALSPADGTTRSLYGGRTSQTGFPRPDQDVDQGFFRGAFFAAVRFAAAFFAGAFFAVVFFAVRLRGVAGPFARRSASSSAARSMVISSTLSPLRRLALVSPSVTYGPNRPSRTVTVAPDAGSLPSSRSGSAAARRPRVFGCASSAS